MLQVEIKMVHSEVSIEPAALRQFIDPTYEGPKLYISPEEFQKKVSEFIQAGTPLVSGYSPFCKHLIVPNFCFAKPSYLKVTPENEHLLQTVYDAHHPDDLPVLTRFFPAESVRDLIPDAQYLDVILYERSEINQANAAQGKPESKSEAPWGVMRIKAQVRGLSSHCVASSVSGRACNGSSMMLAHDVGFACC